MANIRFTDAGAVRAVLDGEKRILEILAAPFGDIEHLDRYKQYFSDRTNFMIEVGDRRPTLYLHGHTPRKTPMIQPTSIGVATVSRIDEEGLWMETEIDDSELSDRTWRSALKGNAVASTGTVGYLVRPPLLKNGKYPAGEVRCWPIAELSIYDSETGVLPISTDTVVLPLRALFDEHDIELPENFEAGEDKKEESIAIRATKLDYEEIEMDKKEINEAVVEALAKERASVEAIAVEKEAMRAEIRKELEDEAKKDPNYRATFNINKIEGDKGLPADELETFAFMRALIQDGQTVANGGTPSASAMRAATPLQENQADELEVLVPEQLANKIHEIRGKYSIVRRSGMETYTTDKLTFVIPVVTTTMIETPTVAEAAGYQYNVPLVTAEPVTMLKKGDLIAVTEEVLEDQGLFQQFLVRECGRSIALAENAVLYGLIAGMDGVETATTKVILDAELVACYYGMAQEYRDDGAVWLMNDLTLGYIRSMVLASASTRAYGDFGFNPMSMGEAGEHFMGKRVFTNAEWTAISATTQDDLQVATFINLSECIAWVDRKKLSIFVDPYSTRVAAGTINYLPSARFNGVVVNSAAFCAVDGHES